jgi:hypothetical protein
VFLCVLYGSENKQRLFPYTTLTDWFVEPIRIVFTARYVLMVYNSGYCVAPSTASGYEAHLLDRSISTGRTTTTRCTHEEKSKGSFAKR